MLMPKLKNWRKSNFDKRGAANRSSYIVAEFAAPLKERGAIPRQRDMPAAIGSR